MPVRAGLGVKGEQRVRRRETGPAFAAKLPAAIKENAAFSAGARKQIRAAQIEAHHFVRRDGIGHADVRDMMQCERGAFLCGGPEFPGPRADDMRFRELLRFGGHRLKQVGELHFQAAQHLRGNLAGFLRGGMHAV